MNSKKSFIFTYSTFMTIHTLEYILNSVLLILMKCSDKKRASL